ncbi:MAG: metal-dependent transcriptional regulator [bacterium]|jgi:DtxR family Mn-dependent transcriptional regulator|nr:metal-dependent transcriptional regulator [bacterium]
MLHPLLALFLFFVALALLWFLLWPDRGKLWQWKRMVLITERVLIEDVLKHAFEDEFAQKPAEIKTIAAHLNLSPSKAERIVAQIKKKKLGEKEDGVLRLTPEGRDYALRIIRAHRLWEQYLSEKTGVAEKDWHKEAERREHSMSPDEIEALAKSLGNPLFDPHGDPIPTASGEYQPQACEPISLLQVGDVADICHIEDEPSDSYQQIAAEGLAAGMRIQIIEKTPEKIRFWAEGNEYTFSTGLAKMISAQALEEKPPIDVAEGYKTLASLAPGESATVLRIAPTCRGLERRRLMDFGIVPGTHIVPELHAIGRDPVAYRVRGTLVALRKEQANQIYITPQEAAAS